MMSEPDAPFEADEAQATPPQDNFPEALVSTISADDEEDDEWEYEYSTTETETYYVTLDLTTPDLPARHKPAREDGPKRARWTNPGNGRQARTRGPATKVAPTFSVEEVKQVAIPNSKRKAAGSDQEDEGDDDDDDADGNPDDGANIANRRPTQVQILNLDSDNPIVAYGGHFYSCQWASNIGTEMLFTERKEFHPIPALRQLPDNVDLLATSSARIISKHVQLMPKKKPVSQKQGKRKYKRTRFEDEDDEERAIIPVGRQASDGRKEQAAFLSQMIQIKEEQGDEDMVTVNVRKRLSAQKWLIELKQIRREEKGRLREVIENGDEGDEDVEIAREKLKEMEKEDKGQGWVETPEEIEEDRNARVGPPKTGPGSRGGRGRARRRGATRASDEDRGGENAKEGAGTGKRRGRPSNAYRQVTSNVESNQEGSVDIGTPSGFSEQFSAGTPGGFDSNVAETPRDFESPMGSGYDDAPTPNGGFYTEESPLNGESPSQQLFHDMGLHDEDAEGEEDDMDE